MLALNLCTFTCRPCVDWLESAAWFNDSFRRKRARLISYLHILIHLHALNRTHLFNSLSAAKSTIRETFINLHASKLLFLELIHLECVFWFSFRCWSNPTMHMSVFEVRWDKWNNVLSSIRCHCVTGVVIRVLLTTSTTSFLLFRCTFDLVSMTWFMCRQSVFWWKRKINGYRLLFSFSFFPCLA